MGRLILAATLAVALAGTAATAHAAAQKTDAVADELRAYDQLLKPTADALAAIKCDTRDCVPALLMAMRGHDQAIRRSAVTVKAACAHLAAADRRRCDEGVQKRAADTDRTNTERLKAIVEKYGWPSTKAFGESAEQAAWTVALHADHDRPFQHRVLELLERSAAAGDSPLRHQAYLYDRVAVAEHKPQRWGTQGRCIGDKWEPFPIENPDAVDARRSELGLPPIAAWRSSFDPKNCAG